MSQAHVQVIIDGQTMPAGLQAAISRIGATASFKPISEVLRSGLKSMTDAVVVISSDDPRRNHDGLHKLFQKVAHRPRATLVIQPVGSSLKPLASPPTVPVSFSNKTSEEDLAARISTMIGMRNSLESLHQNSATAARSADEKLAAQYQQQLRQASQVQRELLPHSLPRFGDLTFEALYRAQDYVSGDIYDIRRLDHEHVAVALVDTQGHGISAALLTVFIKRALRGENRKSKMFRPPSPNDVLTRLNEELLEAELSETQFAAAVYAIINLRTRQVELARGGAPYPIYRHADGSTELIAPTGPLVGVTTSIEYSLARFKLEPGDSLVLYSDGLEQICRPTLTHSRPSQACNLNERAISNRCECAPDRLITMTEWYGILIDSGVEAALEHLKFRYDTLRRLEHPLDDLTVLAINVDR